MFRQISCMFQVIRRGSQGLSQNLFSNNQPIQSLHPPSPLSGSCSEQSSLHPRHPTARRHAKKTAVVTTNLLKSRWANYPKAAHHASSVLSCENHKKCIFSCFSSTLLMLQIHPGAPRCGRMGDLLLRTVDSKLSLNTSHIPQFLGYPYLNSNKTYFRTFLLGDRHWTEQTVMCVVIASGPDPAPLFLTHL